MPKLEIDYNKALFLKLDVDSSDKTLINVEGNTLLVNWLTTCLIKEFGGLDILNLQRMNIALLMKWWWRFLSPTKSCGNPLLLWAFNETL